MAVLEEAMTIDLTPAELREFARLWKLSEQNPEGKLDAIIKRIEPKSGEVVAPLALALADAMEERDRLRKEVDDYESREAACCPEDFGFDEVIAKLRADLEELKGNSVHADVALDAEGYKRKCKQLEADLEAARVAINYATENILDYDDAEWAAWNAMPAVRAALGKDADGND